MSIVRIALLGVGGMGKKYARMISDGTVEGLQLTAVYARGEESASWARETLPSQVFIARTEEELYAASSLFDAVLIVTPHKLHPSMALRALEEGKHVLSDKPAATTMAEALAMEQKASALGLTYGLMCQQRAYDDHQRLKALLEEDAIGQVTRIGLENTRFFRTRAYHKSSPWRSSWTGEGGGALINQGYHLIDLWVWLFGLPRAIYAHIPFGKYQDFLVDDEATLVMEYPGKATGTFFLSTREPKGVERLVISGTKGRILLEDHQGLVTRYEMDADTYACQSSCFDRTGLGMQEEHFTAKEIDRAYQKCLQNFTDALRFGTPLLCPGEDGTKALALVNAAYYSAYRQAKVSLPVKKEDYAAFLAVMEGREAKG